MRIALVAPVYYPVNKDASSGVEVFVYQLARKLKDLGHDVVLFASGDSDVEGITLSSIVEKSLAKGDTNDLESARRIVKQEMVSSFNLICRLNKESESFDVLHINSNIFLLISMQNPSLAKKSICTLHVPAGSNFVKNVIDTDQNQAKFISISKFQSDQASGLNIVRNIYNGIDLNNFVFSEQPTEGKYVWLGRISREKGLHIILKLANEKGWNLEFAGKIFDQKYFDEEIKSQISDSVRYVGEIHSSKKSEFLGSGVAMLMPITWDEPFGLTVIESMACGTPVVAFERGAMSELIENGKNGFLVAPDDLGGFALAVEKCSGLDRKICRECVENNYQIDQMIEQYEGVYKSL